MTWRTHCPAKVNLFLAVGPPEANGYHPLRTTFQAIGLADELEVSLAERDEILCNWAGLPENNTLTKALRLAREPALIPPLRITLTKRIPSEAGLGGGSSDAAGLLRILRLICPQGLPDVTLGEIALAVGADVPFFLVGGLARGQGYGERLTPLPDDPPRWLVVVKPPFGVATGPAYQALDAVAREWRDFPPHHRLWHNDFESVAPPEIAGVKEALRSVGAVDCLMSGSGSAVFGLFGDQEKAVEAARLLADLGECFACRTLTREESLWTS